MTKLPNRRSEAPAPDCLDEDETMLMLPGSSACGEQLVPVPATLDQRLAMATAGFLFADATSRSAAAGPAAADPDPAQGTFFRLISGAMEHHVISGDPLQPFDFIAQNYVAVPGVCNNDAAAAEQSSGQGDQVILCSLQIWQKKMWLAVKWAVCECGAVQCRYPFGAGGRTSVAVFAKPGFRGPGSWSPGMDASCLGRGDLLAQARCEPGPLLMRADSRHV